MHNRDRNVAPALNLWEWSPDHDGLTKQQGFDYVQPTIIFISNGRYLQNTLFSPYCHSSAGGNPEGIVA